MERTQAVLDAEEYFAQAGGAAAVVARRAGGAGGGRHPARQFGGNRPENHSWSVSRWGSVELAVNPAKSDDVCHEENVAQMCGALQRKRSRIRCLGTVIVATMHCVC